MTDDKERRIAIALEKIAKELHEMNQIERMKVRYDQPPMRKLKTGKVDFGEPYTSPVI